MQAIRMKMRGRVTVYGGNVVRPPLCDDPDASIVVVRNAAGSPMILLMRLQDDNWGLVTPEDDDWEATCIRLGFVQPPPMDAVLAAAAGSH